jgi:hypothetical protein
MGRPPSGHQLERMGRTTEIKTPPGPIHSERSSTSKHKILTRSTFGLEEKGSSAHLYQRDSETMQHF